VIETLYLLVLVEEAEKSTSMLVAIDKAVAAAALSLKN
jgi:hypothetical protein